MTDKEVISGLEAMLERANLAHRKIEYNSVVERLNYKVSTLEERLEVLENIILRMKEA